MSHSANSPFPGLGIDIDCPVLLCGVDRSATSHLGRILGAHSQLALLPRTHFFRRYVADEVARAHWELDGRAAFLSQLELDSDFRRAGVAPRDLFANERSGISEGYRTLLRYSAGAQGKARVADDDPMNIDYLPALARAFPGGYILHVIRDPRFVLLSRMAESSSSRRAWWTHPLVAREQLQRGRELGVELFGTRYFEVSYEALVNSQAQTLRQICAQIDLGWEPAMLAREHSASLRGEQKRERPAPTHGESSDGWRSSLTPTQITYTEKICSESFDEFGYERSRTSGTILAAIAPILRAAASFAHDLRRRRAS